MRAEEVPDELVEAAKPALRELLATEGVFAAADHPRFDFVARRILAAVLPLYEAAVRKAMVDDLTWLADAREEYGPDPAIIKETDAVRVALSVAQGEPAWGWLPSWRWDEWKQRAARLRAAETERTS